MKKRNLKSLRLNKISISNFQSIKGGADTDTDDLLALSYLLSCWTCPKTNPDDPIDPSTFTDMPSWHNTVCDSCV